MSTSRTTHLYQQEGKRAQQKMADASRYKRFATKSEDKAQLRVVAEQAHGEWQFKNQHRVLNLSDKLRNKY